MYQQFKMSIFPLNERLKKVNILLKQVRDWNTIKALKEYKTFLSMNLSFKFIFLKVYNKLFILNPKFVVFHYLNLLDRFKLLRFNYRFAMYKQGLCKMKNIVSINTLRYKKKSQFSRYYRQNRFGFIQTRRKLLGRLNLSNSSLNASTFVNFKIKNFLNVFYRKIARFDLRYNAKFLLARNHFDHISIAAVMNFRKIARLVNNHIDSVKMLAKRSDLLKRRASRYNYKYFLEFLSMKRVYRFGDKSKGRSIKSTLKLLINQLVTKGHNKLRIRKYLGKRYVFLLLKKFINKKYGRRSISRLKLFFFKQAKRLSRNRKRRFRSRVQTFTFQRKKHKINRLISLNTLRTRRSSSIRQIKLLGLRR